MKRKSNNSSENELQHYMRNMRTETKTYIDAVLAKLDAIRQIDDADYGMIHLLATNYNMFIVSSEQLGDELVVRDSKGDTKRNPLIDIKQKAENCCIAICRELLATPKSRKTLKDNTQEDDNDSPLAKFFAENPI